jgi:hypothetical protein
MGIPHCFSVSCAAQYHLGLSLKILQILFTSRGGIVEQPEAKMINIIKILKIADLLNIILYISAFYY